MDFAADRLQDARQYGETAKDPPRHRQATDVPESVSVLAEFLIGRDGKIIARFDVGVEPGSREITKAIEAALAAK